ncbi:MAG: sulfate adenylyltransferase subunit CysD [Cyanobacteria bacterium]|nr:sulfate adenylyltransferase subunit CysD [Cyanobacteriota bacterium]MDA1020567.1 sulfate adenylyltransferase subunit CysD [Cyanobacteriota bacterium]
MSIVKEELKLNHLRQLEAESIHIIREVAAEFKNPVMLYSVGKDSSVMLHLARKAFYPAVLPFPLMHVDTGYKFPEMYTFRDEFIKSMGAKLIIHKNEEAMANDMNPFKYGTDKCCAALKTGGLLAGLEKHGFDAAFGGARREEEKSRAKERVYSIRDEFGQWDPKNQRPELWNLYNSEINEGESIRVFPLSNWTEVDIWEYIKAEEIPIVPIYYAQKREVVMRNGVMIPIDRSSPYTSPKEGEEVLIKNTRFRSLGCMPCTGAVESDVTDIDGIIEESKLARKSERENRVIDLGSDSSMEDKKKDGYF